MKILHVNTYDSGGGAEQFSYDFVHFSGMDCRLLVKSRRTSSEKVIELPSSLLDQSLSLADKVLWKAGIKKTLRQIFSLGEEFNFTVRKLREMKAYREAGIIHLHNIHGGYFDLDALIDIAAEKPIVWSLHDMWALTGGEAFTFGDENYRKGIGTTPYDYAYPLYNPLIDRRQHYIEKKKKIYKSISRNIVFVPGSNWLRECLTASSVYDHSMNVKMIHECIDSSAFINKHGRRWETPRVLIINSDSPFKGSDILDFVFSRIKGDFDLHIIGPPLRTKPNSKKAVYHAYMNNKTDLCNLFNEIDFLFFSSRAENFPLTVLAAMSCGVCVIGSSVGGITEQLQDGNGILFNPDNPEEAINITKASLENLHEARKTGEKASVTVKTRYDVRTMYAAYENLYGEVILKK